jgi:glycosyltransferase involved in cell wall biosynthesis
MKKRRVGLYDPYIDTLGGGEKHILSILEVLANDGYEIDVFWNKNLTKEIKSKFSFQCFKTLKFVPDIFHQHKSIIHSLETFRFLKAYDNFFYVTDGSYFFSGAEKNYVFCMVPQKNLYDMNPINKLKTANYRFISNSQYTKKWLDRWGIKNDYLYPYIDDKLINSPTNKKEKIILCVGRFFPQLHSKQHKIIIETFAKLQLSSPDFKDYKLILAGGLKHEDKTYFEELKNNAKNNPAIIFKPNVPLDKLYELYKLSNFFWHFAGYGIDENIHPEMVEHLGITPLEAMAAGAITFSYNAGGPKEIITDGQNGFLFDNEKEIIGKMQSVLENPEQQQSIRKKANEYIHTNFSFVVFTKKVQKIIL